MVEKTPSPSLSSKRSARLKAIGVVVLVLGLASAGLVYWTRSPDLSDDVSMLGYNRAQTRQMGMLYGKMGLLIEDWTNELKQPGTRAEIIASVSILIALGCFYFARLLDDTDKTG